MTLYNWHWMPEKKTNCNLVSWIQCRGSEDRHKSKKAKSSPDQVSKPKSFLSSLNIIADLKGPSVKYNLHYGWCTGRLFRATTWHNTSWSNKKLRFFKSKENIYKNEDDCSVSNINSRPFSNFQLPHIETFFDDILSIISEYFTTHAWDPWHTW